MTPPNFRLTPQQQQAEEQRRLREQQRAQERAQQEQERQMQAAQREAEAAQRTALGKARAQQADAERLVSQRQREQEKTTNDLARQAEQQAEQDAKDARKAELSQKELEYRSMGMTPVTTADGNIHPDPLWEQKQAEKAAEAQSKAEQDALELKNKQARADLTRKGVRHSLNPVDGSPIAHETEADVAARMAQDAHKKRQEMLDEQINKLDAEHKWQMADAEQQGFKRLHRSTDGQRPLETKVLPKLKQDALFALQSKLQEQTKTTDKSGWWDVVNNQPTPEAQAAQERLNRLSQPGADLTEEDIAELEADDATKPIAAKIREAQAKLAKDDELTQAESAHKARIASLKLKRDNPDAWLEAERQRRLRLSPEELKADLEASAADLEQRRAAIEEKTTALNGQLATWNSKLDELSAQAAQRRQQGLTAGEMVTYQMPDGTVEHWPKDLAAKREEITARAQDTQAMQQDDWARLQIEQQEHQREVQLLNEASQHLQTRQEAQQKQQIDTGRRRLQFTPGMEQTAQELDALRSDAEARQQALAEMHPDGIPDAAQQALQQDIDAKAQAALATGQQRFQTAVQVYADIQKQLADNPDLHASAGDLFIAARQKLMAATGLSEPEARRLLADAEALDWDQVNADEMNKGLVAESWKSGKNMTQAEDARKTRILSNGAVIVHPRLTSEKDYKEAVQSSSATPEAKQEALDRYPEIRAQQAKQTLDTIQHYQKVLGEDATWKAWEAKRPKDVTPEEWALQFVEKNKAATEGPLGAMLAKTKQFGTGLLQSVADLVSQSAALGAGILGSNSLTRGIADQELMGLSQRAANSAEALGKQKEVYGQTSDSFLTRGVFDQLPRLAGSLVPAAGGSKVAMAATRAFAGTKLGARLLPALSAAVAESASMPQMIKAVDTLRRAGMAGAAGAGGAQTYAAQLGDIYTKLRKDHPEMTHTEALQQAQMPALYSGLATSLLTLTFGSKGIERFLTRPQEAKELAAKVFTSRLQQMGFVGKEFLKGGAWETLEEAPDEAISQMLAAAATAKPGQENAAAKQALIEFLGKGLPELAVATGVLGGLGQGAAALQDSTLLPENERNPANLPENVATAWTAIDSHQALDANGNVDAALTEQQQRRAALALHLAQGGDLFDVDEADLNAAGWTRDGTDFKPLKDYQGPKVLDIDKGGLPVIKDSYVQALRDHGLEAVANAIPGTETETRNRYAKTTQPGQQPAGQTQPGPQQPQPAAAQSAAPDAGRSAAQGPVQTPAGQGTQPASSGQPAAQPGNAVEGSADTPVRSGSESPATVADTLANHLVQRGLPEADARAAAAKIAALPEFDGMSYEQIIAEGPKFRAALDDLGIDGSLNSKDIATNPLKAKPGGRLEKVKAEMEAKAEEAKRKAEAENTSSSQEPPKNWAEVYRRKLADKEISDQDAAREVAKATGATTEDAFVEAVMKHLGWKKERAQIAAHLHFGTKDDSAIPLATGKRTAKTTPADPTAGRIEIPQGSTAPAKALRKSAAWSRAKLATLGRIKDPSIARTKDPKKKAEKQKALDARKAWARQFLSLLENDVAAKLAGGLYDALAIGPVAVSRLGGQMTAVVSIDGKITRLIDLDAMLAQFDYLGSPAQALAATNEEENVHAGQLRLEQQFPEKFGKKATIAKWRSLSREDQRTIYVAYHNAQFRQKGRKEDATLPKAPLTDAQAYHLMREYERMYFQTVFRQGAVTEAVDPPAGLIGWLRDMLAALADLVRQIAGRMQPEFKQQLDQMAQAIDAHLAEVDSAAAANPEAAANPLVLRDPGSIAVQALRTGVLFNHLAKTDPALAPEPLARLFDQLTPDIQSLAFQSWRAAQPSDAGTPARSSKDARKAPKDALLRHLLADMAASTLTRQQVQDTLLGSADRLVSSAQDAEYMAAVEAGDMAKAQRMVDEAAKNAGYTVEGWHGSQSPLFDVFDRARIGDNLGKKYKDRGFWFSDRPSPAQEIASLNRDKPRGWAKKFWLRINRPTDWDRDNEVQGAAVDRAQETGSDAVIFRDVWDGMAEQHTQYQVFDPSQIKSADPVTRDKAGNVIPLSQRFNPESDSILYSASRATPQQAQKNTSLLTRLIGSLVKRTAPDQRTDLQRLLAAQPDAAKTALATLHVGLLKAAADLAGTRFVQSLPPAPTRNEKRGTNNENKRLAALTSTPAKDRPAVTLPKLQITEAPRPGQTKPAFVNEAAIEEMVQQTQQRPARMAQVEEALAKRDAEIEAFAKANKIDNLVTAKYRLEEQERADAARAAVVAQNRARFFLEDNAARELELARQAGRQDATKAALLMLLGTGKIGQRRRAADWRTLGISEQRMLATLGLGVDMDAIDEGGARIYTLSRLKAAVLAVEFSLTGSPEHQLALEDLEYVQSQPIEWQTAEDPAGAAYVRNDHVVIRQQALDDLALTYPHVAATIPSTEAERLYQIGLRTRPAAAQSPTTPSVPASQEPGTRNQEPLPIFTPLAEGQSPFAQEGTEDTPARPTENRQQRTENLAFPIPLSKRGQVRRSQFPDADSLAAFQFKLDADTVASARSTPAEVKKAEQRGLALLARLMEDTGLSRGDLEKRLLDYHATVVAQAEAASAFGTFTPPSFASVTNREQRTENSELPPPVGGDILSGMKEQGMRRLGPPDASDGWAWYRELQADAARSKLKNAEAQRLARAGDITDPKARLAWLDSNLVSQTGGRSIDEAAAELNESDAQQFPVTSGEELGRAILDALDARLRFKQEGTLQQQEAARAADATASAQDFATYAAGTPGQPFTVEQLAAELEPEDEIQIGSEWFTVQDTAPLTLDSARFGSVTPAPGSTLNLSAGPNHLRITAPVRNERPDLTRATLDAARAELRAALQEAGLAAATRSPAFKRWFGQSKVVNPDGTPRVVFHGTEANFDAFQPEAGRQGDARAHKWFFTNSAEVATSYALAGDPKNYEPGGYLHGDTPEGANIMPVYLSLQNPLEVDAGGEPWDTVPYAGKTWIMDDLADHARSLGYDGLIVLNVYDAASDTSELNNNTYVAFKPTQIKSVFNPGTWNRRQPAVLASSPRIRSAAATYADNVFHVEGKRTFPEFLAYVAGDLPDLFPTLKTPHLRSAWNTLMAEKGLREITPAEEAAALRPYTPKVERRFGEPPPDVAAKAAQATPESVGLESWPKAPVQPAPLPNTDLGLDVETLPEDPEKGIQNKGSTAQQREQAIDEVYGPFAPGVEVMDTTNQHGEVLPHIMRGRGVMLSIDGKPHVAIRSVALPSIGTGHAPGNRFLPLAGDKSNWTGHINKALQIADPRLDEHTDVYIEPYGGGLVYLQNLEPLLKTSKPILIASSQEFEPDRNLIYTAIKNGDTASIEDMRLSLDDMNHIPATPAGESLCDLLFGGLHNRAPSTASKEAATQFPKLVELLQRPNVSILPWNDVQTFETAVKMARSGRRVTLLEDSNYADLPGEGTEDQYASLANAGPMLPGMDNGQITEFIGKDPAKLLAQKLPVYRAVLDAGGTIVATNNMNHTLLGGLLAEFGDAGHWFGYAHPTRVVPDGWMRHPDGKGVLWSNQRPEYLAILRKGVVNPAEGAPKYGTDTPAGLDFRPGTRRSAEVLDRTAQPRRTPSPHTGGSLEAAESLRQPARPASNGRPARQGDRGNTPPRTPVIDATLAGGPGWDTLTSAQVAAELDAQRRPGDDPLESAPEIDLADFEAELGERADLDNLDEEGNTLPAAQRKSLQRISKKQQAEIDANAPDEKQLIAAIKNNDPLVAHKLIHYWSTTGFSEIANGTFPKITAAFVDAVYRIPITGLPGQTIYRYQGYPTANARDAALKNYRVGEVITIRRPVNAFTNWPPMGRELAETYGGQHQIEFVIGSPKAVRDLASIFEGEKPGNEVFYPQGSQFTIKRISKARDGTDWRGTHFQGTQITVTLEETAIPRHSSALFAAVRTVHHIEPGFYSALAEAIRAKMPARSTPSTVVGILKNAGLKQEELKWTGIVPWLQAQAQDGPLTQQQVLDYLATEGSVKFTLTRLNNISADEDADQSRIYERYRELTDQMADLRRQREEGTLTPSEASRELARISAERSALDDRLNDLKRQIQSDQTRNTAHLLPGGTNPQEVVVTWNRPNASNTLREIGPQQFEILSPTGRVLTEFRGSREQAEAVSSHYVNDADRRSLSPNLDSDRTHYGDLDALAWYRTTDRTNAAGNGLLVEEFQSKWHQRGREEGYRGERKFTVEPDPAMPGQMWLVKDPQGNTVNFGATEAEAQRWADAYAKESGAIPDAPYRASWPLMLFKRALLDAVQSGKQWIGWTTGDTQADRYDLSKEVDEIKWYRHTSDVNRTVEIYLKKHSSLFLTVSPDGTILDANGTDALTMEGKPLAEAVGKEIARQILESTADGKLDGPGLKVGGQGMRKFYDNILVKEFGKYVKQLGGGTVESAEVDSSTSLSGPAFQPISDSDWEAFAGAEAFANGDRPLFAETTINVDGQPESVVVIIDANGLQMISSEGDTNWMVPKEVFPGRTTWNDATLAAMSVDIAWKNEASRFWRELDPIVGEGKATPRQGTTPIHLIRITPAMREAVTAGQALFAAERSPWRASPNLPKAYQSAWDDFTAEMSTPFDLFPHLARLYESQTQKEPVEQVQKRIIDAYLTAMKAAGAIDTAEPTDANMNYLWEDEPAFRKAIEGQALFASSRLPVEPQLDLRYVTPDGQDSSEARARSNPLQENHLGGGPGANAQNPRQLPVEAVQLLDWAQAQGWLIDPDDLDQRLGLMREIRAGDEHDVWHDELTDRAVKLTRLLLGKPVFIAGGPLAYVINLKHQNALFGTGFTFEGIVEDEGQPRIVTSMPWIPGTASEQKAKEDYFKAHGFEPAGPDTFYSMGRDLLVSDARPVNVLQRPDGTVQPIDIQIRAVSPRQAEMWENRVNAYAKGLAAAHRSRTEAIEATGLAPAISVNGKPYTGQPGMLHPSILGDYVWRKVFTPQQRRDDPNQENAITHAYNTWMDARGSGFDDFGFLDTRTGKFLTREEAYTLLTERGFTPPTDSYSSRHQSLDSLDLFNSTSAGLLPAAQRVANRNPRLAAWQNVPGKGDPESLETGYISGKHNDTIARRAAERGDIGLLVTPLIPSYLAHAAKYPFVAVDNGVFSKATPFSPENFRALVERVAETPDVKSKVLFVVAPDVVGDADRTLAQFNEWVDYLHSRGLPAALAAQDGLEDIRARIPWDQVDVLFIGGSTEWKTGQLPQAKRAAWAEIFMEAHRRGIPIHMGRVNTNDRIAGIAQIVGASTVDGTYLAFGPDKNLPKLEAMLDELNVHGRDLGAQRFPELGRYPSENELYNLAFDEEVTSTDGLGAYEPAAKEINAIRVAHGLPSLQGRRDNPQMELALWASPRLPVSESPSLATQVAAAAAQTNTNPTQAQKDAENYKTGKVDVHGLRLSIENPAGSTRSGTDANGKPWSVTLPHHYGRILGTTGRDKDHLDFFLGPNSDSQLVLIVNQRKTGNGHFDEHKIMLGFNTPAEAARGYLASYTKGWQGLQSAVPTTIPVFKHWLTTKDTTQPVTKEQLEKLAKTVPLPSSPHDQSPVTEVNPVNPVPLAASNRTLVTDAAGNPLVLWHTTWTPDGKRFEQFTKSNDPSGGFWFHTKDLTKQIGGNIAFQVHLLGQVKEFKGSEMELKRMFKRYGPSTWDTDAPGGIFAVQDTEYGGTSYLVRDASQIIPLAAANRLGSAITRTASAVASGTERTLQVANTLTEALGIQQPLATFGSNNLDKKIAAQLDKLVGPKVRSAKTAVETWLDKPDGLAPSIKGIVDQLLPSALLPREWLALHHEMQRKSAHGQETANDLIRALSGNPRLSDLAYPKEFAENPAARAQLFDAMEGRIPMATLPPAMQRLGERLRDLLRQTGSELVRQGLMNPDTFEELQSNGWMPRYTEDEARESAGSFLAAFKLGVRDLLQQRSTAYHIVDTTRKDKTGQFVTVSRDEGGKRNRWRFRDAASRDAFYHDFVRKQTLDMLQDRGNAIVADMLAPLSRGDKIAMRDQIKSLTVDQIANTAKLSPMLAGIVKQAKKHQYDRFLPKDPFEPAKLVKDPVYAVARYVLGQTHNAATMELLRKTAQHPEWVSDIALNGFTAIPDASRFGPLAGKHVRKDIAAQILDLVDVPNAALQFYDAILRKWKAGKLVWNPGSHIRDAVGNTLFAYISGSSIWNPGNWPYYQQAIAALRTGGADFAELIEQQVIGGDAYTGLVKERLKGLLPDPKTVEDYNPGLVQRLLFGFGASLHGSHEFLASLRRLPDDLFKSAAYFKAKAELAQQGTENSEQKTRAAEHVRKWFPYYDRLGQSGTTRAVGRFVNPFFSFFRESTRILGTAVAERPLALTAALAFPAVITALSAMMLGLDDDDMEQIQKDMAGKGKLFAFDTSLFSMLLPFRSAQGAVQQFDISAIMPFADLLGTRVAVTDATEDPWNRFWRGIVSGGPVLSLIDAWRHNEDAFTRRPIAEFGMTPLEKITAYTKHAAGVALPPLAPGGTAFNTLMRAGDRATNKTLETYDTAQAVIRSVAGLNVKNATPDLYRLADDWRKAHGYEVTEGMDYGSTTPASRARKALFAQLAQDEPNLTAISNILKSLDKMGHPVRSEQDINKLLFYRDPLKLIGGNKARGITPQNAQAQFRASLTGEARAALEKALQEYQRIKAKAPLLVRQAASL